VYGLRRMQVDSFALPIDVAFVAYGNIHSNPLEIMSKGPHCSEVQARESLFEAVVMEEAHAKGAMLAFCLQHKLSVCVLL
jgi:hypothetical protein